MVKFTKGRKNKKKFTLKKGGAKGCQLCDDQLKSLIDKIGKCQNPKYNRSESSCLLNNYPNPIGICQTAKYDSLTDKVNMIITNKSKKDCESKKGYVKWENNNYLGPCNYFKDSPLSTDIKCNYGKDNYICSLCKSGNNDYKSVRKNLKKCFDDKDNSFDIPLCNFQIKNIAKWASRPENFMEDLSAEKKKEWDDKTIKLTNDLIKCINCNRDDEKVMAEDGEVEKTLKSIEKSDSIVIKERDIPEKNDENCCDILNDVISKKTLDDIKEKSNCNVCNSNIFYEFDEKNINFYWGHLQSDDNVIGIAIEDKMKKNITVSPSTVKHFIIKEVNEKKDTRYFKKGFIRFKKNKETGYEKISTEIFNKWYPYKIINNLFFSQIFFSTKYCFDSEKGIMIDSLDNFWNQDLNLKDIEVTITSIDIIEIYNNCGWYCGNKREKNRKQLDYWIYENKDSNFDFIPPPEDNALILPSAIGHTSIPKPDNEKWYCQLRIYRDAVNEELIGETKPIYYNSMFPYGNAMPYSETKPIYYNSILPF